VLVESQKGQQVRVANSPTITREASCCAPHALAITSTCQVSKVGRFMLLVATGCAFVFNCRSIPRAAAESTRGVVAGGVAAPTARCGINCVYFLLRLCDVPTSAEAV
jgi:hypothetical protein